MKLIFLVKTLFLVLLISWRGFGVTEYRLGDNIEMEDLTESTFYDISDFVIYGNRFYIADSQFSKLYLFSETGKFIKKTGRQGRGPGEYEMGPHRIVPYNNEIKVVDYFLMHINIYDKNLNYINARDDEFGLRTADYIHNIDDKLYLVKRLGYDHHLSVFSEQNAGSKNLDLGFEIMPGLLFRYDIHPIGNKWLFAWHYQNRFEVYDEDFRLVDQFKIDGLPEIADGLYSNHNITPPPHADSIQARVLKAGAFAPLGSFFESVIVLNDEHFMIQLGDQTGGKKNALILNKVGRLVQKVELPVHGIILTSYSDKLFIYSENEMAVLVYPFYK